MSNKLPIKLIVWDDAEDLPGTWAGRDEMEKFAKAVCLVESVGYVLKKTKRYVTIAADIIRDKDGDTYGRVTKIPTPMIKKITNV
jgi:hypothetical protein